MADFNKLFRNVNQQKTAWGTLIQTSGTRGFDDTKDFGGAGLIYLGRDYTDYGGDAGGVATGASYAQLDPYLAGASKHGQWGDLRGTLSQRMDEVIGFNVDSYQQLQSIYDQLNKTMRGSADYSGGFNAKAFSGSGDNDAGHWTQRQALEAGLKHHAANRTQYDNLVTQFNSIYSGAIQKRDADAAAHAQRLAELEQQRRAAEAAAARSRAWSSNMNMQNRQDENIPETVTSGTAAESAGASGDGAVGDDKRRRGRGSLSSNLGLQA